LGLSTSQRLSFQPADIFFGFFVRGCSSTAESLRPGPKTNPRLGSQFELIEQLGPGQIAAVQHLLEVMVEPSDEPQSEDDVHAVALAVQCPVPGKAKPARGDSRHFEIL
jgi:hypothetical protein